MQHNITICYCLSFKRNCTLFSPTADI